MELPVMDKFCGIMPLKAGCIILGLGNSLVTFFLGLILTAMAKGLRDQDLRRKRPEEADSASDVAFGLMVFMATLFFIKFLVDLVFVCAVYNKRNSIIKKYFLFWIFFVVLFIIGYLKLMFMMGTGTAIGYMLFLAFNLYYISVVRSYTIKINNEENEHNEENTDNCL